MNKDFKKGLIDGIPICLGYLSVSLAFGIFSVGSGLSILETILISLTNLTSAGQLAGIPIIVNQGSLFEMALTEFIINIRYSLMSISLSQKLEKKITFFDRFWMAFFNTDEIFAMAISQKEVKKIYYFGLSIMPFVGWQMGTIIGAVIGDILPLSITSALGVAIYGMFVAIVMPVALKENATLLCVIISIILSCLCYFFTTIPTGFTIIICAVVSSLIVSLIKPYKEDNYE